MGFLEGLHLKKGQAEREANQAQERENIKDAALNFREGKISQNEYEGAFVDIYLDSALRKEPKPKGSKLKSLFKRNANK